MQIFISYPFLSLFVSIAKLTSVTVRDQSVAMASKRKRSSEEERRPPGSIKADNQGSSELCVRYAIAKAVSHYLYVNEKIDIDHGHIMICLVQAMGSIDPVNPKKYDRKVIYVQDKENRRGSKPAKCPKLDGDLEGIPDKSWWEV